MKATSTSTLLLLLCFFLFSPCYLVFATSGIDISSTCYDSDFECIKKSGYDFVIIRGWMSYGAADPNCPHTIYNAWDGGMDHVDVYLFPCAGKDGPSQVSDMVSYLEGYNATYGSIWLDIETNPSPGCAWSSSHTDNCNYIVSMLEEGKKLGKSVGIYASEYMWGSITGDCTSASYAPLWYAHYDDQPSFSDFTPFGGWTHPAMKQYEGDGSLCGIGVDYNWYP